MRLKRFEVTGYKNLRRTVALDDLAGINVIHGENNIGKSNLLQSIDLFFAMLASTAKGSEILVERTDEAGTQTAGIVIDGELRGVKLHVNDRSLAQRRYTADDIFNLEQPSPITLRGDIAITADDWKSAGRPDSREEAVTVAFRIARSHGGCVDVEATLEAPDVDTDRWSFLRTVGSLISSNFDVRTEVSAHGFILVDVHRRVAFVDGIEPPEEMHRTVNQQLLLALYDAKESVEPGLFQRWEIFERAMNSLGKIVDNGRFVITYNRTQRRAYLAVQNGRTRMPIESMGSGVQQIASLLARVLLANSAIVAVEEPELNLRYELQLRLRDLFKEIVDSGLGPRQVILTSHSPAFEMGETFYAMSPTDEGPVVERRPVQEAPAFLQMALGVQVPAERGAFGYVSSDGLLRLSHDIRQQLGVEHGGGVVVLKRSDHAYVEVLSNEQFTGLLHRGGADE